MITDILKSKYVRIPIAVTALICCLMFAAAAEMTKHLDASPEKIYAQISEIAEIVIPFEEEYQEIEILDGEKELFAVRKAWNGDAKTAGEGRYYTIINRGGDVLMETGMSDFVEKKGNYAVFSEGAESLLVNLKTLESRRLPLQEPDLSTTGYYLLGEEDGLWKVVETGRDRLVYETDQQLGLTAKEGYAIEKKNLIRHEESLHSVINLVTGKVEFTAERGQKISGGNRNYWIVRDGTAIFLLDEKYEVALDGRLFRDVSLTDSLVFGTWIEDTYYDSLEEVSDDNSYWVPYWRAYNRDGEEVYVQDVVNVTYQGNAGNTAVLWNSKTGCYEYHAIGQDGVTDSWTCEGYYCYEGETYRPVCRSVLREDSHPDPSEAAGEGNPGRFRWTYAGPDRQPLTEFLLAAAGSVKNGYAVVRNADNRAALLDFERRGEL